ncbi:hypothetical protein [Pseudonocardia endophytica]|uniref:hypothetical protein n=1 Tax=Pseudonocardia endophytica TaxID=401976 RepID=UPI0010514A03|nr:hypothetical protein [Pseudonocardia endophytica]
MEEPGREGAREALLDAGLQLWHDRGWPAATPAAAAELAGVDLAEFRDEFASPADLTCAIFDAIVDERSAAMLSAMADAAPTMAPRMRALLEVMVGDVAGDHRRAVVLAEPIGCPELLDKRRSANRGFAEIVVNSNRESRMEPDHLRAAGHFALGGLSELVFAWLDPASPVERDLVVDHGVRLFESAVRAGWPGPVA